MGDLSAKLGYKDPLLRAFTHHLIQDMRALEQMLAEGIFESDVRRIGAEQELFLIDRQFQPACIAEKVIDSDPTARIVPELARFNIESNLVPLVFGGDCLRRMQYQLDDLIRHIRSVANKFDANVVLVGILPTISVSDLSVSNITDRPRYHALDEAIFRLRGGSGIYQIQGTDDLFFKHESVIVEGCNTSFQTHFQVAPEEFARFYNIAQVVAGPVLAAATNSPLLFGRRLWRETRVALFQQAVDTRNSNLYLREMSPRVHFGNGWVKNSVTEIFKEDIARFRVLLAAEDHEDSFDIYERGEVPRLKALQLHNGTIYRWNRAVYGITDGKPHIRIENRVLPSGPSIVDEVANAAFWFGLVSGIAAAHQDVRELIDFDDAKGNFLQAARAGLASQLTWFHGRRVPAHELIRELVPLARGGLTIAGIDEADAEYYLSIIKERVRTRQTGSQWQLKSLAAMRNHGTRMERLTALVVSMVEQQKIGAPVHSWPLASPVNPTLKINPRQTRVEQYMETDLFTIDEEELIDLVAFLMDWRNIDYVPVEDKQHFLVGLVSHKDVIKYLAQHGPSNADDSYHTIEEIMIRNPVVVSPETSMQEAIELMRKHEIGALPVIKNNYLVGIITEADFVPLTSRIVDESPEGSEP